LAGKRRNGTALEKVHICPRRRLKIILGSSNVLAVNKYGKRQWAKNMFLLPHKVRKKEPRKGRRMFLSYWHFWYLFYFFSKRVSKE
jgi:hypothetical protein